MPCVAVALDNTYFSSTRIVCSLGCGRCRLLSVNRWQHAVKSFLSRLLHSKSPSKSVC